MVKNPPVNADSISTGSISGWGKIKHAAEQLSPWATATEPQHPGDRAQRDKHLLNINQSKSYPMYHENMLSKKIFFFHEKYFFYPPIRQDSPDFKFSYAILKCYLIS